LALIRKLGLNQTNLRDEELPFLILLAPRAMVNLAAVSAVKRSTIDFICSLLIGDLNFVCHHRSASPNAERKMPARNLCRFRNGLSQSRFEWSINEYQTELSPGLGDKTVIAHLPLPDEVYRAICSRNRPSKANEMLVRHEFG
jgi:hypothetical protein